MALQRVRFEGESCELCDEQSLRAVQQCDFFGLLACMLVSYWTLVHHFVVVAPRPAIASLRFGKRLETTDFHTAA